MVKTLISAGLLQGPGERSLELLDTRGRAFDLIVGLILLIVTAPLMLLVMTAIYIEDGGPMLFVQLRVGRAGRMFKCLKFRSMAVDAEARLNTLLASDGEARKEWQASQKLRRDPRVTLVGAFIRKRSLDELPQFINVVMGEMSLVGPRPIVAAEIVRYGRRFKYYSAVRPGLTGLWQISGRSDTDYAARVALDTVYARRRRATLNLRILAATIPVVLLGRGSY